MLLADGACRDIVSHGAARLDPVTNTRLCFGEEVEPEVLKMLATDMEEQDQFTWSFPGRVSCGLAEYRAIQILQILLLV